MLALLAPPALLALLVMLALLALPALPALLVMLALLVLLALLALPALLVMLALLVLPALLVLLALLALLASGDLLGHRGHPSALSSLTTHTCRAQSSSPLTARPTTPLSAAGSTSRVR